MHTTSTYSGKSCSRCVIVILDARQGCWRLLRASIEQVHVTLTSQLLAVWALKPEPFWEKQHVDCVKGRQDCKVCDCLIVSLLVAPPGWYIVPLAEK